jgi:hypothetical protein
MTDKPEAEIHHLSRGGDRSAQDAAQASVAALPEGALEAAEAVVAPEPETPPVTLPVPAAQPGLPSAFQDHALNFITEVQIKGDAFKAGRDALVAELDGKEREFDATRKEMRVKFDAELERLTDAHLESKETLEQRISNMDLGLEIVAMAIEHYNERQKSQTQNIRDGETQ